MKRVFCILSVAGLFLASCSDLGTIPTVQTAVDDIQETVFRYQLDKIAAANPKLVQVYFLALRVAGASTHGPYYTDPSDRLMDRFVGNVPPVKRYSDCSQSGIGAITDRHTGERGVLLWIESIKEITPSEAEVVGWSSYEGDAIGYIFRVKWDDGWFVTNAEMRWIS